jgi:hypothetical protein
VLNPAPELLASNQLPRLFILRTMVVVIARRLMAPPVSLSTAGERPSSSRRLHQAATTGDKEHLLQLKLCPCHGQI